MCDSIILVLARDLEREPRPDGVQRVCQGDSRHARARPRHELVAMLHHRYVDAA